MSAKKIRRNIKIMKRCFADLTKKIESVLVALGVILMILIVTFALINRVNEDYLVIKSKKLAKRYGIVIDEEFKRKYWNNIKSEEDFKNFSRLYDSVFADYLSFDNDEEASAAAEKLYEYMTQKSSADVTDLNIIKNFNDLITEYRTDVKKQNTQTPQYLSVNEYVLSYNIIWQVSTACAVFLLIYFCAVDREYSKEGEVIRTTYTGTKTFFMRNITKVLTVLAFFLAVSCIFTIIYCKMTGFDIFYNAPVESFYEESNVNFINISAETYMILMMVYTAVIILFVQSLISACKILVGSDENGIGIAAAVISGCAAINFAVGKTEFKLKKIVPFYHMIHPENLAGEISLGSIPEFAVVIVEYILLTVICLTVCSVKSRKR